MSVSGSSGSPGNGQPRTYMNVNCAVLYWHSKVNPLFRNPVSLPGLAATVLFLPSRRGTRVCAEFPRDEDKPKTVNKGCAAISREKLMGETVGVALMPVLSVAMPGGTLVTVRGWMYYGSQAAIFGASRLLESLVDIGGDSL